MIRDKHDMSCWCGESNTGCSFFRLDTPHLHCFKCNKQKYDLTEEEIIEMELGLNQPNELRVVAMPQKPVTFERGIITALEDRAITRETAEKYKVEKLFNGDIPYGFAYNHRRDGEIVAQKVKRLNKQGMHWNGDHAEVALFGQDLFPAGGKYITITEGEEDAMACYQMLKAANPAFEPPVMSIPDGALSADKCCKKSWEYINSFENIVIAFDGDDVGKKAAEKIVRLFNYKPKVVLFPSIKDKDGNWSWKDSNDYLKGGKAKEFVNMWWRAEKQTPPGVCTFKSLWDTMIKEDSDLTAPYPWEGLNKMTGGLRTGELVVIKAPPKLGKCFGKDTHIRMFDGSVKNVQDIVVGDYLMGDDGNYRSVSGVTTGQEMMYAIHQTKRDTYVVNESHILCIKNTDTKEMADISLKEYLTKNDKIRWKGYSAPILRQEPIDLKGTTAYMIGLWLGDGSTGEPQITNTDPEIIAEIYKYAESHDLSVTVNEPIRYYLKGKNGRNSFTSALKDLGILHHKVIPHGMTLAPFNTRYEMLAGLIDSDGYYDGEASYIITQKDLLLATGIQELARSLGLRASLKQTTKYCYYKGEKREGIYYNITICGNLWNVPCRVKRKIALPSKENCRDHTVCGLTIEPLDVGTYYGFVVDGNHRFLLADGTVVHNTQLLREIAYHLRSNTKHNVGLIFLEDTKKSIGIGMCALHMNKPIQFGDIPYTLEELQKSHEFMSEDDRLTVFDPEDDRTVENIFNKIMYFVKAQDCRFIILDHISMLAYQNGDGDERRFLDKLVADLKAATTTLNIGIIAVTHVNDDGKTRGSRAPVQLCNILINLIRDKMNIDPVIANTTEVVVEENRKKGKSGTACHLYFNPDTGRMEELEMPAERERALKFDE